MEEIEDGRDEGEEEDAVDAASVRSRAVLGRDGTPTGLGCCGGGLRGCKESFLGLPSLKVTGCDATSQGSWPGARVRQRGHWWDPVSYRERLEVLTVT